MRKRKRKRLRMSNFSLLLVVFKRHHRNERVNNSLANKSKGSWDGLDLLSLSLEHACLKTQKGLVIETENVISISGRACHKGALRYISSEQWSVNAFNISAFYHISRNPGPRAVGSDRKQEVIRHVQVINDMYRSSTTCTGYQRWQKLQTF